MRHSEGSFDSEYGEPVYYQGWNPTDAPRAVLVLVHGLAEHSGRYAGFAEFFTAAGYAVHALDHPGHGKSAGTRGHIRRFSDFTNSLARFLDIVREEHPGKPLILVGHSLGGLIAAAYLIERESGFVAAVLSGSAIKAPEPPSRIALIVMRFIARLFPRFGVLQLDAGGVSRDPQVVADYENDPLVFRGKITSRMASEVFSRMGPVLAEAASIELPVLILHGSEDTLTDVEGSKLLHQKINSKDKKIIVYDGLYHEIFNEPERIAVMTDMKDWLDSR